VLARAVRAAAPTATRYTPDEIRTALALVNAGVSQRAAAAAVGASKSALQGRLKSAA